MIKKGFTLIELVAAIAIFAIGISAISMAFSTSINTWKRNNVKMDTVTYAQTIVETFKSGGKDKLKSFSNDPTSSSGVSAFAYFDDGFNNFSIYLNDGTTINAPGSKTFNDWYNVGSAIRFTVSNDDNVNKDNDLFTKCKSHNTSNKKYGAYIMIKKDTSSESEVFYLKTRVWNLQQQSTAEGGTLMEIYLGR